MLTTISLSILRAAMLTVVQLTTDRDSDLSKKPNSSSIRVRLPPPNSNKSTTKGKKFISHDHPLLIRLTK